MLSALLQLTVDVSERLGQPLCSDLQTLVAARREKERERGNERRVCQLNYSSISFLFTGIQEQRDRYGTKTSSETGRNQANGKSDAWQKMDGEESRAVRERLKRKRKGTDGDRGRDGFSPLWQRLVISSTMLRLIKNTRVQFEVEALLFQMY